MDTTYFGRSFGVMVLIDSISGKALSVSEVKYETNEQYFTAIGSLKAKGIEIQSIVCDGRRGLVQMFPVLSIHEPIHKTLLRLRADTVLGTVTSSEKTTAPVFLA